MAQNKQKLPTTSYAVLGLLSFGEELSGYQIRKWAQTMHFFYWSPAQSQVYGELQRLETRGFVVARKVEQDGKPNKRLYTITDLGLAELKSWMTDTRDETTIMKHGVVLKLFFGHMATPDLLADMLTRFIEETEEIMGQLSVVQEYMENDPKFAHSALAAEWGYHYHAAELEMARKLRQRLSE